MPLDSRAKEVVRIGRKLFSDKTEVDSLWQEIALNFYPERADFTTERSGGEEFSDHLYSSYPQMARRELGNMMAASLRPRSQKWFGVHVDHEELDKGQQERAFLEFLTDIQWRATYERRAGFTRATKEADHDFATFGNAVIKITPNTDANGLLYRNYHLRDCAWMENAEGKVDVLFRKWHPTAHQLMGIFPNTISEEVKSAHKKDPNKIFKCFHAVLPSRLYNFKTKRGKDMPFVSLYVEEGTETVLVEEGLAYFCYVVPRWQTIAGSHFGSSMATAVALPDGRTTQVVVRTLREAGEKYVDPPMLAQTDVIRGDVALYPGGITTVDMEYDERLGEALRPITQDRGGMPVGFNIADALREDIRSAFFLDKIQLPVTGTEMTAFEVRRRLEEHIRASAPIFEPIEQEYNDPICELAFEILKLGGAFPLDQMPESLSGQELRFSFRSPLADMADQQDAQTYMEIMQSIWMPAAQIDEAQLENIDLTTATRDAARSGGWKAAWFKDADAVEAKRQEMAQQAEAQQMMEQVGEAGAAAEQGGKGIEALMKGIAGGGQ